MSREILRSEVKKPSSTRGKSFKSKKQLNPSELEYYNRTTRRIKDLSSRAINYEEAKELMTLRNQIIDKGIISYGNPTIKEAGKQIKDYVESSDLEKETSARINDMANLIQAYNDRMESTPAKRYTGGIEQDRNLNIDEFKIESEQPRERRIQEEGYVEKLIRKGFEQIPRDVLRERLLSRMESVREKLGGVQLPQTIELGEVEYDDPYSIRPAPGGRGVQLPQTIELGEVEYDDPYYIAGRMPQGQQGRLTRAKDSDSVGNLSRMETLDPQFISESSVQQGRMPQGQQGRFTRGENNIGQIREMETVEPSLLPGYGIARLFPQGGNEQVQKYRPKMPSRPPPPRPRPRSPSRPPPRRPIENEEQKHDFGTSGMDGTQRQVQLDDNILKTEKPLDGPQLLSALESSIDLFTDLYKMLPENKDIFQFYENLRRKDQNQANELLNDIINEVEVLSGGSKDSLFNAQDLTQTPSVNDNNGFPLSAQQRGQIARHLTDIDESEIDLPSVNEVAGEISLVDINGVNVFRNRNLANLPQREQPGSIEETIRNNIKLSEGWSSRYGEQDRGFIRDQYASQDSRSDLLMQAAHKKLNKWNPYLGSSYTGIMRDSGMGDMTLPPETMQVSGDRVVQGGLNVPQGVAPLSIEQARAKPSGYRQPDRKYRGNAVELLRQSNRTSQSLANEFM